MYPSHTPYPWVGAANENWGWEASTAGGYHAPHHHPAHHPSSSLQHHASPHQSQQHSHHAQQAALPWKPAQPAPPPPPLVPPPPSHHQTTSYGSPPSCQFERRRLSSYYDCSPYYWVCVGMHASTDLALYKGRGTPALKFTIIHIRFDLFTRNLSSFTISPFE